jgi:hypothetical protein
VPAWGLVGLRLAGGTVDAFAVDEDALPGVEDQQRAKELIALHYRRERWWGETSWRRGRMP